VTIISVRVMDAAPALGGGHWTRMRPSRLAALVAFTLAVPACQNRDATPRVESAAAKPDTAAWAVSPTGVGPIRFGTTRGALLAALGMPARQANGAPESCTYVRSPGSSRAGAAGFMVVNDTVVRVDVDSSSAVATRWGDRVGDTEAAVLERHAGSAVVQPHKYTGPIGHYVIVETAGDTLHRVVFETDGKRITGYRAGRRPAVDWAERCG
jgi:hypothetical protein